jgi:hypothetical protein
MSRAMGDRPSFYGIEFAEAVGHGLGGAYGVG